LNLCVPAMCGGGNRAGWIEMFGAYGAIKQKTLAGKKRTGALKKGAACRKKGTGRDGINAGSPLIKRTYRGG